MKKSFLCVTHFAVIAALVCIGCSDNGAQNKNPEVGEFINMFVGGGARYTLSVNAMPPGYGTVSRNPESDAYKAGSKVAVKAMPKEGYAFIGWSGTVSDANDSITITMNGNMALTANFQEIRQYTLTAGVYPSDGGSVSRNPSQTNYTTGTIVTVTATAADGYTFTGWTGSTNETTESVTITMSSDMVLTANFQKIQYTLTTNVSPSGGGSVSRSPNQINYASGTNVTVTATAASDYMFMGWSGDTTSTTNPMTIIMNNSKILTANFQAAFTIDTRDGKRYKVVNIGNQTWMAENLNYETTTGSWCHDNETSKCNTYGRLYNWDTAKRACPSRWHLSTREEWDLLAESAGGTMAPDYGTFHDWLNAGELLRAASGWVYDWDYNGNVTDEWGFSALPGGYRHYEGSFDIVGLNGFWWTDTEDDDSNAYHRYIGSTYDHMGEAYNEKSNGYSVRCVQDVR